MYDRLKVSVVKYLSGKLAVVQIVAGCGAFVGRTSAVLLMADHSTPAIVIASLLGSTGGYIATYSAGYLLAFRRDYRTSGRFMPWDITRLQLVEQLPNVVLFAASGAAQGALIGGAGLEPVIAVNLASWLGPHKLVNLIAMATSNSLKRAWVDGTWKPIALLHGLARRIAAIVRRERTPSAASTT
jgi:hypothetical protein